MGESGAAGSRGRDWLTVQRPESLKAHNEKNQNKHCPGLVKRHVQQKKRKVLLEDESKAIVVEDICSVVQLMRCILSISIL